MGALQARLVFLAFVGLAAVIAYNAIFLQNGPRQARFSASVERLNSGLRQDTASIGSGRKSSRPDETSTRPDTVRAIQQQLKSKGYHPGPADGVHGFLTRAAIMAFEHDQGVAVTGEASEELLKHIVFGEKAAGASGDDKAPVPEETVALIRAVQQILAKMGYDPGPVDGIAGAGTRTAIRKFEEEQKLPVKGRISGRFLTELVRVTGAKLATIKTP